MGVHRVKIVFSGCTSLQVSEERKSGQISKIDVPASIVQALRSVGHEVDWRKVTPGEDLSSYDLAWVNLAPINSLNGRSGAMGALWMLGSGLPCVGYADDWQFSTVWAGMRSLVRRPETLTKYLLTGARDGENATYFSRQEAYDAYERVIQRNPDAKNKCNVERYYFRDDDEHVLPYADRLVQAAAEFNTERWAQGMILVCPMYAWGNRALVRKRLPKTVSPVEALDPSSTIYDSLVPHDPLPPEEKKREWVLGALMPHDTWVEKNRFTWPLSYVGSRKMIRTYGGQRFKTESDVIDHYNQHWGILSPPYPHAGSGWWRSRFIYSARVRSVLVADKGEGDPIGSAYKVRIADVERMSTEQLVALAEEQALQLRPWMPTPEMFTEHVNRIVERAVREDKGGAA
jgi:hypothetical protein